MKKIFLAILAVCAIFAGCSKENDGASKSGEQSIIVQFPQGTTYDDGTRAVEAPANATTETSLTNAIVFLLNGNTVVDKEEVTPSEMLLGYKKFDNVSSTVNGVLVVANVPSADVSTIKTKSSVAEIEKYPFTIASQSTSGVTGKVLLGKDNTLVDGGANPDDPTDTDAYKKADVELKSVTARFEIGNVTAGTGVSNVKLEGVWINNYFADGAATAPTFNNSESTYWDITPVSNTVGSASAVVPSIIPAYTPTQYRNLHDATVNGTSYAYAFQLFAGSYIPHVIMLVSGQYTDNTYFLGWLTFNYFTDDDNSSARIGSVEGNRIYKVGLGGISVDKKNITTDPELSGFDLGVNCTIAAWTVKNVTPGIE